MSSIRKLFSKIQHGTVREMLRELAWIGSYGTRYRWHILWYTVLGLVGIAMGLVTSVLSKYIIDTVLKVETIALIPAAVFYVVMQLTRILAYAITARINVRVRVDVEHEIRKDVYEKVMNADWQTICEYHSGDILNRVDNDVASITGNILGWIPDFVTRLVQFAGALGVILYYDPTLALLALLSAPVTLLVSKGMARRLRAHSKTMRQASSRVMAFTEESLQNLQDIKSFGLTEAYAQRLDKVQGELRNEKLQYNHFQIQTNTAMSLVGTVVASVCFCWGVYRLWSGHITYGTMTLFLQLSATLSGAFSSLVQLVPGVIAATTAAGRIMAITRIPSEDRSWDEAAKYICQGAEETGIAVEAKNLSYTYTGGERVFDNAGFRAEPGRITALVGPSGEGKTTILRLILGIVRPDSGELVVQGNGRRMQVCASTRRLFAYVPQRSSFFSGTLSENLRLMNPEATEAEIWEALQIACADRFVKKLPLGLESPVQEQGGGFSQGQIQRLMLARALLSDAPVLLLDEATSALDNDTERAVLQNLAASSRKRTCIVTTHRIGVLSICHRVYRVSGGKITHLDAEMVSAALENNREKENANA